MGLLSDTLKTKKPDMDEDEAKKKEEEEEQAGTEDLFSKLIKDKMKKGKKEIIEVD
jgi:hypothetical protein